MMARDVADLLDVSLETVRQYRLMGWLSAHTKSGKTGRGQRTYFDSGEVEEFKKGGAPAAQAYRERNLSNGKPRRGRNGKVTA